MKKKEKTYTKKEILTMVNDGLNEAFEVFDDDKDTTMKMMTEILKMSCLASIMKNIQGDNE